MTTGGWACPAFGSCLIRAADDARGVPEHMRERLFQPFAGSGRPDSTGLGLAIARELAQGHGGDLTLSVTGEQGTVFELRLPGVPEPKARARKVRAEGVEGGRGGRGGGLSGRLHD